MLSDYNVQSGEMDRPCCPYTLIIMHSQVRWTGHVVHVAIHRLPLQLQVKRTKVADVSTLIKL